VPTNDFAILPFTDLKNQALKNLGAVLEAGKSSFDRVLKTTILLKDMNDFAKVNTIYGKCSDFFPYRLCICVCVVRLPDLPLSSGVLLQYFNISRSNIRPPHAYALRFFKRSACTRHICGRWPS
jgi:hypothetical protein